MKGTAQNLAGVMPRPLPETRAIDYFVRATDTDALTRKTREYVPPVVPGNACRVKGVAVGKDGAGLTIGLTKEGQNPVPRGFNRRDIAFVILASGALVTLAVALKGGTAATASSGTTGAAGGGGISTAAIVGVGAVVVAGAAVAVAASNRSSSNTAIPTQTPTPTVTPTPTRTSTPTIPPLRFVQAEVTWSGLGDIDLQILDGSNQSVGQLSPAGCESTAGRTERVLLQFASLVPGTYRVVVTGKSCGAGTPASIPAVVVVQTESGPKCSATFINVPVPGTVNGCSFIVP